MQQKEIEQLIDRQQAMQALDQNFYHDPEIYRREIDQIYLRSWLYAGHVSEIENKGDWFLFNFDNESVIIVRDEQGEVHALLNICRHRGSRIRTEAQGCSRRLSCPYHGWTYALDGRLLVAAYMDPAFDKSAHALKSIKCEILEGMIFVNFDTKADTFDAIRANLTECLQPYRLDTARVAHRQSYRIEANWKLAVENYCECYHCAPSHPEFAHGHALARPGARSSDLMRQVMGRATACGLSNQRRERVYLEAEAFGADYEFERYPLLNGYLTGSADGKPVAPLLGDIRDYDGGATDFQIGPVNFALAYCDYVVLYRFTPVSLTQSDCDITWLVRGDAQAGVDYDKEKLTWLWDITTRADKKIVETNAAGVASRFYTPGPYSEMETYCWRFIEWYLQAIRNCS